MNNDKRHEYIDKLNRELEEAMASGGTAASILKKIMTIRKRFRKHMKGVRHEDIH